MLCGKSNGTPGQKGKPKVYDKDDSRVLSNTGK